MRRMSVLAALVAVALAGCGSSSSQSPRDTELSYFPAGSPIVALLATDPNGIPYQNASGFIARFPLARFGLAALQSSLAKSGINFAQQIKPLLGNPVVVGSPTEGTASGNRFLLVFVAKDAGKLNSVLQSPPAPRSEGSYDGAKLYQSGSYALAVSGATALLGTSLDDVKSALALHAKGGGISGSAFDAALAGLPQDTLVQLYGNLTGVLSTPSAANARLVPWIAAIRSYAATLSVTDTGISAAFRIDTSGHALSAAQLPLPLGQTAPAASTQAPVAAGVMDLAHLIAFGESALQAADPGGWAKAPSEVKALLGQLTGAGEVDYGKGGFMLRAGVTDPGAARRTLARFKKLRPLPGAFYTSTAAGRPIRLGIVGSRFVLGQASPAALRAFADQPATPIAGAAGPLGFRVSLGQVISLVLAARHTNLGSAGSLIGQALSVFGDIVGYATNDPSGLRGTITLPLH